MVGNKQDIKSLRYAIDALEIMMKIYKGTIIFVTHDNTLINNVADIIYEIKDKKINRIKG